MNAFLFILLALFWGGSYLAIRVVVDAWPPFFGAAFRVALALIVLLFVAGLPRRMVGRDLRSVFRLNKATICAAISGVSSMGIGWACLFWGERHVTPAVAAIISAAAPIFTTLSIGWFEPSFQRTWRHWAGVFLGFAGIFMIFGPQLGGAKAELGGLIAVLVTAMSYGFSIALMHPHTHSMSGRVASVWQALAGLPVLILLSALFEPWPPFSAIVGNVPALMAIVYLSLCSTALALVIWFRLLRSVGAVSASTVLYFIPIVSLLLDAVMLKKLPGWHVLAGALVILFGVALARGRHQNEEAELQEDGGQASSLEEEVA